MMRYYVLRLSLLRMQRRLLLPYALYVRRYFNYCLVARVRIRLHDGRFHSLAARYCRRPDYSALDSRTQSLEPKITFRSDPKPKNNKTSKPCLENNDPF